MTTEMDRIESYVFDISGDHLHLSSSESVSSPSNSSIGKNSDDDDEEDNEAESSPDKGPLDLMEALEEVLPVRKGISNYYNGKSKSFTNLAEDAASALASCYSSMKDLAKPENPYSRRRRNLLCHKIWEKSPRGRISKRQTMSSSKSKSALTLAVVVAAEEGSSSGGDSSTGTSPTTSTGSPPRLCPGSQGSFGNMKSSHSSSMGFCAWRSYSVAETPRCFPATASGIGSTDS
ncbi:Uncharacterized protein Rs2_11691 [Raphanus sativus]|uniref:Protein OXIDATIVE STRESS 3 LIKE 1-like n=1 Tax=Raphanus sativus TaxID=3726 RepID=A0A9W3DC78_RAPSA|nr:protein OXIDATIVE STRESS 3 LIKE 1-like [Raphanus sativus]KAJ4908033.1 Uncharacterized protein Rs2_11691 [Raphanus sativus]